MTRPRVAVAAAEPDLRRRIIVALRACGLSASTCASAEEVGLASALPPDLLVAACDPRDSSARATLQALTRERDDLRLVVVCESHGGHGARLALARWIDGFVFADTLEATLGPTTIAVLAGLAVVPRRMRALLDRPTLSYREKQILALVALGYTNGQIGARLFLAESTVKSHLSSAFTKLGVRSRSDAAALVLDPDQSQGLGMTSIIDAFNQREAPLLAG